ncbi:hypothetical protein K3495_g10625 [Podosphaera aphanis]|nr:hypothetical protein K3495_g10625 [Podosphaera aphanis]
MIMSNPYEIDHNIRSDDTRPRARRRPSMTSFFSHLAQVEMSPTPHNPHATPTPVDMAAAERLLQDQLLMFRATASSTTHQEFLQSLITSLNADIDRPPTVVPGVSQSYLDQLERVSRKALKKGEECKICGEEFLADEFCLVVQLPCHPLHRFDLECIGPWLRLQGTCPVDRKDLEGEKKMRLEKLILTEVEEDDDYDEMFA